MSIGSANGIVGLAASGIMGLRECLGALAQLREAAAAARGVVLDLRHVVFTLSLDEYEQFVRTAVAQPMRLPIALVVSEAVMPFARAYAEVMSSRGLPRQSFPAPEQAAGWLLRAQ